MKHDVFREIYTLPQIQLRGRWVSVKSFRFTVAGVEQSLAKGGLPKGDPSLMTLKFPLSHQRCFLEEMVFREGVRHEL